MNRPSPTPEKAFMDEGSELLQAKHLERAYAAFKYVAINTAFSHAARTRAYQMAGVTSRRRGKLMLAYEELLMARDMAAALKDPDDELYAAILRDLGAVQEALLLVTGLREYLVEARDGYAQSVRTLRALATIHRNTTQTEPPYRLQSELLASESFEAMFAWRTSSKGPLRDQASEQLLASYTGLKQLNAKIAYELGQGYTETTPFKVYETNALMRVVRASSIFERIRHYKELRHLTSKSSASRGRRWEARVALVGGDWLYRRLEQYRMTH